MGDEPWLIAGHLQVGDSVLGYDLRTMHLVGVEEADLEGVPLEVYLVKKKRPERGGPSRPKPSGLWSSHTTKLLI